MLPRFTTGQILLAIVAVACGLAVARLPGGTSLDFVLVTLSTTLAWSLARRLLVLFNARREFTGANRRSAALLSLLLAMTAAAIGLGVFLRFYSAAGWLKYSYDLDHLRLFLDLDTTPLMLVLLGMLIAVNFGELLGHRGKQRPGRKRSFLWVAILCLPIALVAYWCNHLLVWLLVHFAINGVELANPSGLLRSQPLDIARDAKYFAIGTSLGLPLCLAHAALIAGCVLKWQSRRWRFAIVTALVAVVIAECGFLAWLLYSGLRTLSPCYVEALALPPWHPTLVGVAMGFLFSTWLAFRWTVRPHAPKLSPDDESPLELPGKFFHERAIGALAVGTAGTTAVAYGVYNLSAMPFALDWHDVVYYSTLPESLIAIATGFGGFALTWRRWRPDASRTYFPQFDVTQFATLQFAITSALFLGAPMIAAFTFGAMLVGFGATH